MPEPAQPHSPSDSPTTRWSLVLAAADRGGDRALAQQALAQLCQMYWRPVLQFILRRGYSEADAKDLTQDFFLRFSEAAFLQKAHARYGRFRALLFSALKHLLCDKADERGAQKRGGGLEIVSLEEWMRSDGVGAGPSDPSTAQAQQAFDYDWAALVVRNALGRLQDGFAARGKVRQFEVLRSFLSAGEKGSAYADAASELSVRPGTVKAMVHRLRGEYGGLLREEVAQTLADERDLDDEVRHLCRILADRQP